MKSEQHRQLPIANCRLNGVASAFAPQSIISPQSAIGNRQSAISSRPGFTVIELLVVIGIILILIALFVGGLKHVTMQTKIKDTKNMLLTAQTMLENYKQATHFNRIPGYLTPSTASNPNTPIYLSVCNAAFYTGFVGTPNITDTRFWTQGQEYAPGTEGTTYTTSSIDPTVLHLTDPKLGDRPLGAFGGNFPCLPPLVNNTEVVMAALEALPENQTILNNLPASKKITDAVTGVVLLLDGFGNPILFCPGGGLVNVWVDPAVYTTSNSLPVITSVGIQPNLYDPTNPNSPPIVGNQPFFVSGGPDGDISNAHGKTNITSPSQATPDLTDDNIYSFQN